MRFQTLLPVVFIICLGIGIGIVVANQTILPYYTQLPSASMEPTFPKNAVLLVSRFPIGELKRFDIVIYKSSESVSYTGRIIALPGEKITLQDGRFAINGQLLHEDYLLPETRTISINGGPGTDMTIPPDSYYIINDNRSYESGSLLTGKAYRRTDITGRVVRCTRGC